MKEAGEEERNFIGPPPPRVAVASGTANRREAGALRGNWPARLVESKTAFVLIYLISRIHLRRILASN